MTHRTTPPPRICPNCDGFASAAITLGGRDPHGHLRTITAHCPACQGTGTTHRRARRNLEGARA
jgi:DnaJ-class molecular chaperone